MNNEMWDDYLDAAVSRVRDKRVRAELREELLDHLEDRRERFLRFGSSDEEAAEKAVEVMGSREELAEKMGALYSFSPFGAFSHAVNFICFGLFCSMMVYQILYWKFLVAPIGVICIFYGLLRLKNASKGLKRAFYMSCVYTVYKFIMYGIMASELWAHENIFAICSAADFLLLVILVITIISGFIDLMGGIKAKTPFEKKIIDRDVTASDGIIALLVAYIFIGFFALMSFIPLQVVLMGVVIYHLVTLKRHIEMLDSCPDIKPIDGKRKITAALCVILTVAVPLATSAIVSLPKYNAKEYVVNDIKTDEDISVIRAKMVKKGVPEFVVNDLPDSEILNYKDLKNLNCTERDIYVRVGAKNNIPVETYCIEAETEQDDATIRALFYFRWKEQAGGFRDSVYVSSTNDAFVSQKNNNFSYKLLYDENDKTYTYNAVNKIKEHEDDAGIEYRVIDKPNLRGYFAVNMRTKYSLRGFTFNVCRIYEHQEDFINYPYGNKALYPDRFEDFRMYSLINGGEKLEEYSLYPLVDFTNRAENEAKKEG